MNKILTTVNAISIHAPLARCDYAYLNNLLTQKISIHAPLARCDDNKVGELATWDISIHAPLARCDCDFNQK